MSREQIEHFAAGFAGAPVEAGTGSVRFPDPLLRPTMDIPEACRWLGIGTSAGYRAAKLGDLPTIRVSGRLLVVTAGLAKMLGLGEDPENG